MSEQQDRLDEIRQRRAAMPEDQLTYKEDIREEYYSDWWRVEDDGELIALCFHSSKAQAEFIAHAPEDIDHLLGEVERLQGQLEAARETIAELRATSQ